MTNIAYSVFSVTDNTRYSPIHTQLVGHVLVVRSYKQLSRVNMNEVK